MIYIDAIFIICFFSLIRLFFSKDKKYLIYNFLLDIIFIWIFIFLEKINSNLDKIEHWIVILTIWILWTIILYPLLFIKIRQLILLKISFKLSNYFYWKEFLILFGGLILWFSFSSMIFWYLL